MVVSNTFTGTSKTGVPFFETETFNNNKNMRKVIYYTSMITIFMILTTGIDNYYGPEIKKFSTVIFIAWTVQVITRNWREIKEFLKMLYGLDKK